MPHQLWLFEEVEWFACYVERFVFFLLGGQQTFQVTIKVIHSDSPIFKLFSSCRVCYCLAYSRSSIFACNSSPIQIPISRSTVLCKNLDLIFSLLKVRASFLKISIPFRKKFSKWLLLVRSGINSPWPWTHLRMWIRTVVVCYLSMKWSAIIGQ